MSMLLEVNGRLSFFCLENRFYATDLRREWHYKMMADVCLSVCHVPRANSRMERFRKPKIGRMEAHHMSNP